MSLFTSPIKKVAMSPGSLGSQQVNSIYRRKWENTTGTEEDFTVTFEVIGEAF